MALNRLQHFADPHMLLRMEYNRTAGHTCDVCQSKLDGFVGYRCNACDFDVHEGCADYFKETVSFFAHPWHTLKLSSMPNDCVGWVCDLCRETIPTGSLVYRCVGCMFDVHPLCTMLPQTIRSPQHPEHDLCMVPSWGRCNACCEALPVWHYVCGSCQFRLHIACVTGPPSGIGQGSAGQVSSQANIVQQQPAVTLAAGGGQSKTNTSGKRVAKFVLKQAFRVAIDAATGGLASPVLDILEAAMD